MNSQNEKLLINRYVSKSERSTNFELLRILAMSFIVIGHFIGQTHCIDLLSGTNKTITEFLGYMLKISVNVFLFISCWFMVDKPFESSRMINLYLQLWLYTVSLTVLFTISGFHISNFDVVRNIFPLSGKALWFVSTYLVLIALHPFLNKLFYLDKDLLKKLLLILSVVIIYVSTIQKFFDSWLDCVSWFVFIYLFIGYYKKYLYAKMEINKYLSLFLGLLIYIVLVIMKFHINNDVISMFATKSLLDMKSLFNFLCSFCIFIFFLKINIKFNKVINFVAKSTLTVYIIHQTPGIKQILWQNIIHYQQWLGSDYYLIYLLLIPAFLYIVSICTEYIRTSFIMPIVINSKIYIFLKNLFDDFYISICNNNKAIDNVK